MPFYEYEPKSGICELCQGRFMDLQKISDPPHVNCPDCGQACHRVLSVPLPSVRGEAYRKAESHERRAVAEKAALREIQQSRSEKLGHHQHDCALHGCQGKTANEGRTTDSKTQRLLGPRLVGQTKKP